MRKLLVAALVTLAGIGPRPRKAIRRAPSPRSFRPRQAARPTPSRRIVMTRAQQILGQTHRHRERRRRIRHHRHRPRGARRPGRLHSSASAAPNHYVVNRVGLSAQLRHAEGLRADLDAVERPDADHVAQLAAGEEPRRADHVAQGQSRHRDVRHRRPCKPAASSAGCRSRPSPATNSSSCRSAAPRPRCSRCSAGSSTSSSIRPPARCRPRRAAACAPMR